MLLFSQVSREAGSACRCARLGGGMDFLQLGKGNSAEEGRFSFRSAMILLPIVLGMRPTFDTVVRSRGSLSWVPMMQVDLRSALSAGAGDVLVLDFAGAL